jgi:hypothetical protein
LPIPDFATDDGPKKIGKKDQKARERTKKSARAGKIKLRAKGLQKSQNFENSTGWHFKWWGEVGAYRRVPPRLPYFISCITVHCILVDSNQVI